MTSEAAGRMIETQIVARGVRDPRVLDAVRRTPRQLFVPPNLQSSAFDDTPLPLSCGQTISQPYIVAAMTELLQLRGGERVLEIGTGSGYQTAILARLASIVYSAELEAELSASAQRVLSILDLTNVVFGVGDGTQIFRDRGPFDAILSAAAPESVPDTLIDQLADGGRCVTPAGPPERQYLWLIEKQRGRVERRRLDAVRFVPLRGIAEESRARQPK
jgi:protein-L-isoaspartate(D-aspartate) O-methyltransferase